MLDTVPNKPEGIVDRMRVLTAAPSAAAAEALADEVLGFRSWERGEVDWPNHFIHDTEQSWRRDAVAVEDL